MDQDFREAYVRAFQRYCWAEDGDLESFDILLEFTAKELFFRAKRTCASHYEIALDAVSLTLLSLREAYDVTDRKTRFCDGYGNPEFERWAAITYTAYGRKFIDQVRKNEPHINIDDLPEFAVSQDAPSFPENLVSPIVETIQQCAEEHWLGARQPEHNRRVLFAQYVIQDGVSPEEAWLLVFGGSSSHSGFCAKSAGRILCDKVILNFVAYYALKIDPLDLLSGILDIEFKDYSHIALLRSQANEPDCDIGPNERWTWFEIQVLLFHYYNGMLEASIRSRLGMPDKDTRIHEIIVKSTSYFPFESLMNRLLAGLRANGIPTGFLKKKAVYAALIFNFAFVRRYRLNDVERMIAPAAAVANCILLHNTFHSWISNKRLLEQLRKYMRKQGYPVTSTESADLQGGDEDETS